MIWAISCVALALAFLGDPAQADYLDGEDAPYERCALCHGLYGDSVSDKFPKLAGQPAAYLARQIAAFRNGDRHNDGGQMAAIVTELSEADIPVVTQWFSTQPAPKPTPSDATVAGKTLFVASGCAECHNGIATITPHLTSQHPAYLTKQMRELRDGVRGTNPDDPMLQQLQTLKDDQIEDIATYLAAQKRRE